MSYVGYRRAAIMAAVLLGAAPSWASVIARFDPPDTVVQVGELFQVDIVADIPDAVLGWGLDLAFDELVLSSVGLPVPGPLWLEVGSADGDGLAGLAFPDSISGTGILLATVMLSADAVGATDLTLSATEDDLTEGFPLDPTGFADTAFESGGVVVVPAPPTLLVMALGGTAVLRRLRTCTRSPSAGAGGRAFRVCPRAAPEGWTDRRKD